MPFAKNVRPPDKPRSRAFCFSPAVPAEVVWWRRSNILTKPPTVSKPKRDSKRAPRQGCSIDDDCPDTALAQAPSAGLPGMKS
jgi:hypothetical protein